MLLKHGTDLNHTSYKGMTTLLYATSPEVMPADLDEDLHERKHICGADVNVETEEETTALHLTITNGHYGFVHGFVEMFIEHGIDVNAELVDGRTPLDMVEDEETRFTLKYEIDLLRQHGARNGVRNGARQMPPFSQNIE
ncbi:hypothetical protein N7510_004961 [Penicillium lagena]|uniref:uncharacterized protein n=1 Tax=Penicillium lagena TaxID=94218 RepID=UPI00253FD4B2|nr:uncharacterized protein N7510_004961 [Penicillium lagena]KAJ5620977.1 hypothetical protein N7510_004961 [Penicillium lagena]